MNPHTLTFLVSKPDVQGVCPREGRTIYPHLYPHVLPHVLGFSRLSLSPLTSYILLLTTYISLTTHHLPLKNVRVKVRVNRSTLTCLQPFVYRALRPVW